MSHYHVKRVKPRDCPSVFTTCVTRGALTSARTQAARAHRFPQKQDTLSLTSRGRTAALAKCCDCNVLGGTFPLFALQAALPASVRHRPVEEWVRAVGSHGPGVLGHRGGHGVRAAILIHTGGQLVPQGELLRTIKAQNP